MLRVRGFTQDDAHLFCTREQVYDEISSLLDLVLFVMKSFGFDKYKVELSVRDSARKENYAGTEQDWEMAEGALVEAMKAKGMQWTRMEGEAVFYGPKIDVKLIDAIGRPWQLSTVQFDFTLPKRFDLSFIGPDGQPHQPVMLHRALLGSVERFMGVLIEHYAGAFPIWLAPVQVVVIPISERHHDYARQVLARLAASRLARGSGRQKREDGLQDPGGPDVQGALHARGRRQGGPVRAGIGAQPLPGGRGGPVPGGLHNQNKGICRSQGSPALGAGSLHLFHLKEVAYHHDKASTGSRKRNDPGQRGPGGR